MGDIGSIQRVQGDYIVTTVETKPGKPRAIVTDLVEQREALVARIQKIDSLLAILQKSPDLVQLYDLTRELLEA